MKIAIINGPNLNLLGTRKPEVYGKDTLASILETMEQEASSYGLTLQCVQSNSEGALVDAIQSAAHECRGIIINAGAYSHTSIAIHDALEAATMPIIEVHLSNIHKREEFRHHSYVSRVASGVIVGLGAEGYLLALRSMRQLLPA